MTSVSQLLNIVIGGVINPSVQAAFRGVDTLIHGIDRRIQGATRSMGQLMQATGKYLKSAKFDQHLNTAGLATLAAGSATGLAAKQGASLENSILQSIITDGAGVDKLDPTRLKLARLPPP